MTRDTDECEVSVVMPCLNEEKTIGVCIEKARLAIERLQVAGEVVVADNGSSDRSVAIAQGLGARVVHQDQKGYGYAYLKGLREAKGKYIVMGDSDNTYDFGDIERFVTPLRNGADMVMGNRFRGRILPGAMPWHHQYIGNPLLSGVLNLFFHTGVGDAHCGLRSFTNEAFQRMRLQTGGMEFASEMVIHAAKARLRIAEVPITYYPRAEGAPAKLRSFRDGWRHLRFMLLYSPTHLFLWPGGILMALGLLILIGLIAGPIRVGNLFFGFHWMFVGSLLTVLGSQIIQFGVLARFYSLTSHFDADRDPIVEWIRRYFKLETGVLLGAALFALGIVLDLAILLTWTSGNFESESAIRVSILALTLSIIGGQIVFSAFLLSLLAVKRQGWQS